MNIQIVTRIKISLITSLLRSSKGPRSAQQDPIDAYTERVRHITFSYPWDQSILRESIFQYNLQKPTSIINDAQKFLPIHCTTKLVYIEMKFFIDWQTSKHGPREVNYCTTCGSFETILVQQQPWSNLHFLLRSTKQVSVLRDMHATAIYLFELLVMLSSREAPV